MSDPLISLGLRIWAEEAVNLFLRQTMILGAGLGLLTIFRGLSAATRRWVLVGLFGAVLTLPIVSVLIPPWHLDFLPSLSVSSGTLNVIEHASSTTITLTPYQSKALFVLTGWPWGMVVLSSLWILGAVALGARWVVGIIHRRRWVRQSRLIVDDVWLAKAGTVAKAMNIRQRVTYLAWGENTVPHTWGWRRPMVALPSNALEWDDETLRMVLTHELAHVKAKDAWVMGMVRVALALFWFNPFLWVARRRLVTAREQACDNAVLALGVQASDYAQYLLELCRQLSQIPGRPLQGIAMAKQGAIEHRLMAVLDPAAPRSDFSVVAKGLVLLLLVTGAGMVGGVQAWDRGAFSPGRQWLEMRQVRQNLDRYARGLSSRNVDQVAACYGDGYFPVGTENIQQAREHLAKQIESAWIDDFQSARAAMKLRRLDRVGDEYIAIADLEVQGRLHGGQEARLEGRDWLMRYQNENGTWRIRDIYTRSAQEGKSR